jgi:hypothetical protein
MALPPALRPLCLLLLLLGGCATTPSAGPGTLRIAPDGRHLVREDGRPFFWLADTAWELLHRLGEEETALYLDDRRAKGFNVVQTVILAELGGLRVPNSKGDLPLEANDPARPNEAYFRHVDRVLAMAEARGMVLGLLPSWGDKFNRKWGEGPEIFTPDNARAYGAFLGRRYRGRSVVWILGGDRNPETERHFAIVRAMAEGIESGSGGGQLMTYHPQGWSRSSDFFRDDAWIDFHMFQSGHDWRDLDNGRFTAEVRALAPVKPVLDGEPRYEDHPVGLFRLGEKWKDDWFDAFDVRQAAWWSLLAGAAGHTYGNHNIWQMWQPGREPVSKARTPWREALAHEGAAQMGHMRRFLEAHGFGTLGPAQELLARTGEGGGLQRAAQSRDGRYTIVYSPLGADIVFAARPRGVRASWFDPRTGRLQPSAAGGPGFDPPGVPERGNDWVLLLERN